MNVWLVCLSIYGVKFMTSKSVNETVLIYTYICIRVLMKSIWPPFCSRNLILTSTKMLSIRIRYLRCHINSGVARYVSWKIFSSVSHIIYINSGLNYIISLSNRIFFSHCFLGLLTTLVDFSSSSCTRNQVSILF